MRFRRKQRYKDTRRSKNRRQAYQKIWEDPTIIEEIFKDADWQRYERTAHEQIPSRKMAQHIEEEIDRGERDARKREIRLKRSGRMIEAGIAATLLIFIGFNLWYQSQLADPPEQQIYVQEDPTPFESQPRRVSIVNNSDRTDTVRLPDRSTVHLFAQSSIFYSTDFMKQARDIHLEGKAYFSVAKDEQRPFSVYAGGTKTTALGTSFTIDARTEKRHTAIELHSGKVVVASTADIPTFKNVFLDRKGANLLLDAEMRIVRYQPDVEEKTEKIKTNGKKPSMLSAGNLLCMDNIPLSDVFEALQEVYQTAFHIRDKSIMKIQYTGVIDPKSEALADVLTVICLINDLRYQEEEDGSYSIYRQEEKKKDESINENL